MARHAAIIRPSAIQGVKQKNSVGCRIKVLRNAGPVRLSRPATLEGFKTTRERSEGAFGVIFRSQKQFGRPLPTVRIRPQDTGLSPVEKTTTRDHRENSARIIGQLAHPRASEHVTLRLLTFVRTQVIGADKNGAQRRERSTQCAVCYRIGTRSITVESMIPDRS